MESDFAELYEEGFLDDLETTAARHGMTDEEVAFRDFLNRRLSALDIRVRFVYVNRRKSWFDYAVDGIPSRRQFFKAYRELSMANWKRFLNQEMRDRSSGSDSHGAAMLRE